MKNWQSEAPSNPLILVVEDEDVLLELLRGMLEANGFQVMTAKDGAEAVNLYKKYAGEIELVLTDMGLPLLGGWDVLGEILKINPKAKVICASGFLESNLREEMIAAGAAEFIQKPYVYEKLVHLMRSLIASSAPR
ncbi:MAG: response regulator [Ignavibacteriales bacterium]|nr:response regulator [Ignavibacteriales bacterium]